MPRIRELGVWLHGEHVANLQAPRIGRITCRYSPEVVDRFEPGTPLLSCSLPIRPGAQNAWAFTVGLLPEGHHRAAMAALAGVTSIDLLGMLDRFGRDVAGAVTIAAEPPGQARKPTTLAYADGELRAALADLPNHPLGLYDDSELSIAGLQDKMLLVRLPGGWARPVHGYPSTHILKMNDRAHSGLVRAEHECLSLARAAGLEAATSEIIQLGTVECIVVERFDRTPPPTPSAAPGRLHQEDTCQALGIDPDRADRRGKYETSGGPSLRRIAGLVEAWAPDPTDELLKLTDHVVFTVAIGNADAHGRNVALLHTEPSTVRLAPLFDTVPTMLWPALRTDAAMTIGGITQLPAVTRADIMSEASSWGLSMRAVSNRTRQTLERLHDTLRDKDFEIKHSTRAAVTKRITALTRS